MKAFVDRKRRRPLPSMRKSVVEKYIEGFRRSDHALVLSCLTDDVVWVLHGYKTVAGKAAFDAEIENEGFEGSPTLTIDRLIEEGDTVVAVGGGSAAKKGGEQVRFVFCDVFTFTGDAIRRLETYLVPVQ
jgi:ketosteroid isomerase-like protein